MEKKASKFLLSIIQNRVIADKKANLQRATEMIDSAVKLHKPSVIVLSEFWNCPMGKNYAVEFAEEEKNSETLNVLRESAKRNNVHIIGGSIPIKDPNANNKIFNVSYSFDNNGEVKAKYRKVHLFDIDIPGKVTYFESDKITPGDKNDFLTVFETPFCRFGIGICYDVRFNEQIHLLKKLKKIDCMVYPSAFTVPTGGMHWDLLSRMRALDNNVHVVMASPSRNYQEPEEHQVYGYSRVVDPYANVVNAMNYDEGILTATIDLDINRQISEQIPTWKAREKVNLYDVTTRF